MFLQLLSFHKEDRALLGEPHSSQEEERGEADLVVVGQVAVHVRDVLAGHFFDD